MDDLDRPAGRTIRIATPADVKFIDKLQRAYSNDVGFLPKPAIDFYLEERFVRICTENDEPAGYLLGRPKLAWQPLLRPIYQACVAMDAKRRHHGLQLLAAVEAEAIAASQIGIQANCAVGVEANEFWHAAGFIPVCYMTPANARGRAVICWRKPLTKKLPLWFAAPPKRSGHRASFTRADEIAQRKSHGSVNIGQYISRKNPPQPSLGDLRPDDAAEQ